MRFNLKLIRAESQSFKKSTFPTFDSFLLDQVESSFFGFPSQVVQKYAYFTYVTLAAFLENDRSPKINFVISLHFIKSLF